MTASSHRCLLIDMMCGDRLHTGFVPEGNPHESVELFSDLEEALDWHYERYNKNRTSISSGVDTNVSSEEAALKLYRSALLAGRTDKAAAAAEAAAKLATAADKLELESQSASLEAGVKANITTTRSSTQSQGATSQGRDPTETESRRRLEARVMLHAGGRVDPALITAFR